MNVAAWIFRTGEGRSHPARDEEFFFAMIDPTSCRDENHRQESRQLHVRLDKRGSRIGRARAAAFPSNDCEITSAEH
jgi:hypothetical protein